MILADMMAPEGRIFFKSEWGPIDDNWPCLSYTSRRTQTFLQRRFGDGDILLYVGTQNPKSTRDKAHRKKLLSALNLDPTHTFPTVEGITAERWARSQRENPGKFGLSLRVTRAANFVVGDQGLPDASKVAPGSYR
jgi:hypothetical protein